MTPTVEIETKTRINLDIETAALWFANISDDDAAKFFSAVARECAKWPVENSPSKFRDWCHYIGQHMRECQCGQDGRQMICDIADAILFNPTGAAL